MSYMLTIISTNDRSIDVGLSDKHGNKVENLKTGPGENNAIIENIEKILILHNIRQSQITDISVNTEGGSFTGLRIGITIARVLGLIWGVPVNSDSCLKTPDLKYSSSKFDG